MEIAINEELMALIVVIPLVIAIFKPLIWWSYKKRIPLMAVWLALGFIILKWGVDFYNAIIQSLLIWSTAVWAREMTNVLHPNKDEEIQKILDDSFQYGDNHQS